MESSISLIEKLGDRGFAGSNVAANPSHIDDSFWPVGPRPHGVDELINLVLTSARSHTKGAQESHWVFLLGGAGNGKSFAARDLLNRLGGTSSKNLHSSSVPKRKYSFKGTTCNVTVINDATIATSKDYRDDVRIALAQDLALLVNQARKSKALLFACVNRGIILEELHSLAALARKGLSFSTKVLEWLDSGDASKIANSDELPWVKIIEATSELSPYRSLRLKIAESRFVVLHALSVDVGSLFEPRSGSSSVIGSQRPEGHDVAMAGSFRQSARSRLKSSAGQLVSQLLTTKLADEFEGRPVRCPLKANFDSLRESGSQASWLTAIRGAEIAVGRQVTYRDFWGLVVLSIIGPRTIGDVHGNTSGSVIANVDSQLQLVESTRSARERLATLSRLALHRLHMALFRARALELTENERQDAPPEFPSCRGLNLVDPALDVTTYSADVERAMEHLTLGKVPSDHLLTRVPQLAEAWRPFDSTVEEAVISFLGDKDSSDRQCREVQSWFGGYLQRAVGCYVGGLGHEKVIDAWYRCWHASGENNRQFPVWLSNGLRTLLLPALSFQQNLERLMTLEAFSSRAVPCESTDAADGELVVGLPVNHLQLVPSRRLDRLWVELRGRDDRVVAQGPLDFLLLREAVICASGSSGFSEAGAETAPRLERARAAMVSTGSRISHYYGVVTGGRFKELGS